MPRHTRNSAKSSTLEHTTTMDSTEIIKLIETAMDKHFSKAEVVIKERLICLEQRFDPLQSDLQSLKEETKALRVDNEALKKPTEQVECTFSSQSKVLMAMETKLAELEDHSRRNNTCVHGLPEGKEGPNITQFLTNQMPLWFPTLRDALAEIMRTHCVGPP